MNVSKPSRLILYAAIGPLFWSTFLWPGTGAAFPSVKGMPWVAPLPSPSPAVFPEVNFLDLDFPELRARAAQEGRLFFVHFTAGWCMPCQWMERHVFADAGVSAYVSAHYLAARVDFDEPEVQVYRARFEVRKLPTILMFNAQGQLIDRLEESVDAETFLQWIREHNLPGNRVRSSAGEDADILESPAPRLAVYRPPLTDGASAAAPPAPVPANLPAATSFPQAGQEETRPSAAPPVMATIAPRAEKSFSIQVGVYRDYSNAVREVSRLEQRFEEPVNLFVDRREGAVYYRILIGGFPSRSLAEVFLNYLNRNDIEGMIKEM